MEITNTIRTMKNLAEECKVEQKDKEMENRSEQIRKSEGQPWKFSEQAKWRRVILKKIFKKISLEFLD